MREVGDYLDLTVGEAREQWRSVLSRAPVPGGRQVPFAPIETLLCLAASLVVNHRQYGGSTSHRAQEPVPSLARLFRRPNSSVLAKMANLDGSRSNGARHELAVAAALLGTPGRLAAAYRLLISSARAADIDEATLPDFLHLEDGGRELLLLGQEELSEVEIELGVQEAAVAWTRRRGDLEEALTERLLVASARVGQHRSATGVLRNHQHRCVFCGLALTSADGRARRMLVASHIKPWRVSTSAERLDVQNGLTACPTHDVAFDTGLLTVNGGLRIHVNPRVERLAVSDPAIKAAFGRPPLGERLLLPAGANAPRAGYLAWHHQNVYQGTLTADGGAG
jgi:putative restriction endonuclease